MRVAVSTAPIDLQPANHFVLVAKQLLAGGDWGNAMAMVESADVHDRVKRMVKSVGLLGDSTYGGVLGDWKTASDAWFANLAPKSVFFNALGNGMRLVPLNQRMGSTQASVSAQIVGEGEVIPVSDMTLEGSTLPAIKAAAQIVLSKEVAKSETPAAKALVDQALQDGVLAAVDTKFFAIAMVGAPSLPSQGAGAGDISEDLRSLLDAVNVTGAGRLLLSAAPNVANAMTILDNTGRMTPTGGFFKGMETLVSPNQAGGTLRLFNVSGFAGNADPMELQISTQADVDMGTPADSPSSGATVLQSLWMNNLAALKCYVPFGVQKIRDDAAAELTGVAWGNSP